MEILKIGDTDFTKYLANEGFGQSHYVLVNEARDVQGNANFDIINRKTKLFCTFRPLTETEMQTFLSAIEPYNVTVSYLDNRTNTLETINCYVGENQQDYFMFYENDKVRFNKFQCNFIEK